MAKSTKSTGPSVVFDAGNVTATLEGSILTTVVDMAAANGDLTAGGNIRLASTGGNIQIIPENQEAGTGAVMLSQNLFQYAQTKAARKAAKAKAKAATK